MKTDDKKYKEKIIPKLEFYSFIKNTKQANYANYAC